MIIFLDIEGSLHPKMVFQDDDRTWNDYEGPLYINAPKLLEVLQPYLDSVEIVLSDWGSIWPDKRLQEALPAPLAARIVDTLWLPAHGIDYRSALATHFACIQLWLSKRRPGYPGPWLSISDRSSGFEAHPQLSFQGTGALERWRPQLEERLREVFAGGAFKAGTAG